MPRGPDSVLVAVDFTADRLRLLFAEEHGEPLEHGEWPLPALADDDAWSWEVGGRIATFFAAQGEGRSASAIAVAAPGSVDPLAGRLLETDAQPGWNGLAIVEALRRHFAAPIGVENRVIAALLGETWQGAAAGADDVLYVSLRGIPAAALLAGGRPLRGAHFSAGALPAIPELAPGPPADGELETVAGLLADAVALVDPEYVVLDGAAEHLDPLVTLLQRVLDEVAPGAQVVRGALGDRAALVGAARMATTLAFEGNRKP